MKSRFQYAGIHLLVSVLVAALSAALIFFVWYPAPLDVVSGGLKLFALLAGIDVVLGPMLTAVVASPGKPRRELMRDIACIATVQLAALVYGLYAISLARPVAIVWEQDRLTAVSAADLAGTGWENSPLMNRFPWTGPSFVAVGAPKSSDESRRSLQRAAEGVPLAQQPERWVDYASQKDQVLRQARSASELIKAKPDNAQRLEDIARGAGIPVNQLRYATLFGRSGQATVILAPPDARIVGHLAAERPF